MSKRNFFRISTTHIILFSFLLVILTGSLLLSLPISTQNREPVAYIDALFTATTATCVTGLVTLPTVTTWSLFGQAVILILIQIGGLGTITVLTGVMVAMHKRIGMKDRQLIQDAFNLNTMSGLVRFVKKVIFGTLLAEGIGALFYMTVFIPEFGTKGIWISIFNSVSAFCNAGIDIIAENSLCNYATNPMINTVTSVLIILGGLGFIVWWDVFRVCKDFKKQKFSCFRRLTLHSKIVLATTMALILFGALLILTLEYNNPLTLGNMSFFDKLQISFFQSVTLRTAGFATVAQENLTTSSSLVCLILMLIGGSPVGTAGGIKTVTFAVLLATAFTTIRNRKEVSLFGRNLAKETLYKTVAVFVTFSFIVFASALLLSMVTNASALDILYETVSATATVGLSRNLTPFLNIPGKLIIIATMYFGRVGPISLAIAFNIKKETVNIIKNPTENITVG
ncbi:MAG: potassium transporter KtrB [Clostridia bacterium]|nr:potassium transporter KtrB [Clostridia bacterium]